jgi:hypothetical protein
VGRPAAIACLLVAVALLSRVTRGGDAPRDVSSVFFIAKSENKNQVHYGIHLDGGCAPNGTTPMFAYWRMLERGPFTTEPILASEAPAYGFSAQRVVTRDAEGGSVRVVLRALPQRPILVTSSARGGACVASVMMTIAGVPAWLTSVFVQLRWPFGVDHLVLWGHALEGGRPLRENVSP